MNSSAVGDGAVWLLAADTIGAVALSEEAPTEETALGLTGEPVAWISVEAPLLRIGALTLTREPTTDEPLPDKIGRLRLIKLHHSAGFLLEEGFDAVPFEATGALTLTSLPTADEPEFTDPTGALTLISGEPV